MKANENKSIDLWSVYTSDFGRVILSQARKLPSRTVIRDLGLGRKSTRLTVGVEVR